MQTGMQAHPMPPPLVSKTSLQSHFRRYHQRTLISSQPWQAHRRTPTSYPVPTPRSHICSHDDPPCAAPMLNKLMHPWAQRIFRTIRMQLFFLTEKRIVGITSSAWSHERHDNSVAHYTWDSDKRLYTSQRFHSSWSEHFSWFWTRTNNCTQATIGYVWLLVVSLLQTIKPLQTMSVVWQPCSQRFQRTASVFSPKTRHPRHSHHSYHLSPSLSLSLHHVCTVCTVAIETSRPEGRRPETSFSSQPHAMPVWCNVISYSTLRYNTVQYHVV